MAKHSWIRVLMATVVLAGVLTAAHPTFIAATGEGGCYGPTEHPQAGQSAASTQGYLVGARATIEGQRLPLCLSTTSYHSGSFQWSAIYNKKAWIPNQTGANIVQIGYGRCKGTNNDLGAGTLCSGNTTSTGRGAKRDVRR